MVRRRRNRGRAIGARAAAPVLALPNQRWSLDFVHDQMASGRRFRVLNIVDDVTRECLRAVPDTSISGRRVVRELSDLIEERGRPGMIVSDNGTELTSNAVLAWCGEVRSEEHTSELQSLMRISYAVFCLKKKTHTTTRHKS